MRHNISVRVPQDGATSYTVYAQGLKIAPPSRDKHDGSLAFKFLGGTVVAVFYTFAEFRRAYLVTGWESGDGSDAVHLPGVSEPLCLVMKAKGRKIDELKRALYWLCAGDEWAAFRLPLAFWQRLALVLQSRGARKSEVLYLFRKFTEEQE